MIYQKFGRVSSYTFLGKGLGKHIFIESIFYKPPNKISSKTVNYNLLWNLLETLYRCLNYRRL